jgi:hypothetical protein
MAIDTGDKVTRKYANFRGVDFRGEDCSLNRSPDALNVWRNYKKLASIETRPGLEHFSMVQTGVKYMMWHKDKLYFITNDGWLVALNQDGTQDIIDIIAAIPMGSNASLFEFEGKLYAKGTSEIGISFFYNVTDRQRVEHFIPTTTIKKPPSGGGETYQDVNMLSPYRINTFRGDGESNTFYLDAQNLDKDYIPEVTVDGKVLYKGSYKVEDRDDGVLIVSYHDAARTAEFNYKEGYISLYYDGEKYNPKKPRTDGQDNVSIKFKKTNEEYVNKIMKCTIAQEFDNRIFFSGNPDYPNIVWHSSLNDLSYFSDLDYYEDGKDASPIRSLVASNNALWVFRDAGTSNSVFYHVPTFDADYGKIYPSSHSSIALGCVGRAINFNDDIVFFSQRGMESASTDITTEQFATHKSSLVDRKMITHPKYKDMVFAEWEGYLLVFVGNEVYLADSRAVLTNENHYEYEWYYWKLGKYNVTCATVYNGVLYIATEGEVVNGISEGHIYKFTSEAEYDKHPWQEHTPIESYWTTPKDKFGAANKLKTTNKKGCVVEAVGDVDVLVKTNGDNDFVLVDENEKVDDYFVSRIKRKKFKDIQLKFQSQTGFCLESASLECFIGGYIKR